MIMSKIFLFTKTVQLVKNAVGAETKSPPKKWQLRRLLRCVAALSAGVLGEILPEAARFAE